MSTTKHQYGVLIETSTRADRRRFLEARRNVDFHQRAVCEAQGTKGTTTLGNEQLHVIDDMRPLAVKIPKTERERMMAAEGLHAKAAQS